MRFGSTGAAAVMAGLALAFSGCGSSGPGPAQGPSPVSPSTEPGTSGYEIVTVEQQVPHEWAPEAGPRPEVSADLVARMNELGVQLWHHQRNEDPEGDVWVSPVSVYQALSLVLPGAGPDAVGELLSAMGLAAGEIGRNTGQLADWITASRRSEYQMALFNAAFVAQQYGGFAPAYLDGIEPIRDELGGFDALDPQGTADLINGRVDEHTRGMIDEIVGPGDISADLVAILLNTTYFKGAWEEPFDALLTGVRPFTLLDGSVVEAPRMMGWRPLQLTPGEGYTAAALPYVGGATAVFVLPDEGRFEEVVAALTAADFDRFAASPAVGTGEFALPKFTSDSGIQELIPALRSAGVEGLFTLTPDWPMFGNSDSHAIDFVKHRVVVAVTELGTEAAAATAAGGIGGIGPVRSFVLNRPFVMAILDADDAVLFLGQITDPR